MRKISQMVLFLSLLLSLTSVVQAEETFPWKVLRGSPRTATPLQTAEQAAKWLLGPGKGDLALVTSKEDAGKTVVLVEQQGAKALRTIRVKPGNMVSEDNGTTWQKAELKNLVFGPAGLPVVFIGPLSVEWTNYPGGIAYYPAGLNSEWVPVIQGACGNAYLWHRPRQTPPTVTGQVVQTPLPTPTPTPVVAMGPPPDYSGKAYNRPDRVQETISVHTVATVGQVPVPKFPETKVVNSGNNVNTNTQALMNDLLTNIVNNNTNVNVNTNTINAIMQQLQQLVVPIAIGG